MNENIIDAKADKNKDEIALKINRIRLVFTFVSSSFTQN